MQKRWKVPEQLTEEQFQLKNQISSIIKCPDMIAEMLIRKNLTTKEEIDKFFNPGLDDVYDPFIFHDMEKAVSRIIKAIEHNNHK